MKTIGLLGGMSWESTLEYYRLINQGVRKRLGGLHSAEIILHSVDMGPIEELMQKGEWQKISYILADKVVALEKAGAELYLICTNTMHKLAPDIEQMSTIPLVHIADVVAETVTINGLSKIGLLGTAFTMKEDFYTLKLREDHDLEVIVPESDDIIRVNDIIFKELCCGLVTEQSKRIYMRIIEDLESQGAEAVVLGCTEIGMLIQQSDVAIPLFDTTVLHAQKAVDLALADE